MPLSAPQQEIVDAPQRFKVVVAGRRFGKTHLAIRELCYHARLPDREVWYVAPTYKQAKMITWKKLRKKLVELKWAQKINETELSILLKNGSTISLKGADNYDSLRGIGLDYLILDEFADIDPEAWYETLRPTLADKQGGAMFIGTPKGRNWFYDLFNLGKNENDSEWRSWHFTTKDNPMIDPKEIESAKKTLSSFSFKQEYMASFDTAGSDVFKEEWIKYGDEPQEGSYYIACDLAGFEEVARQASNSRKRLDESAIAVVKVTDDGKWWVKKIEHGRWDIKETASKILTAIRDFRPISVGIERGALKNAVLPYLSDLMRNYNVYSHIVDLTHGNRKKADRVIWALQGRFEHGRVVLNSDEDFDDFVDQLLMFPAQGVHDDLPDALSYIDQLAITSYFEDQQDNWSPIDVVAGV